MAVNVKMGVDLSSFNSGIKSAKAEVKTLDQQMKMIEATFKATGDAEEAMKQKVETLNKQMEAQKRVASQAEQALKEMTSAGVDPASTSYQKMAKELLAAQTGMMETQAALNGLGTSAQTAADNTDQLNESVNSIGKKVSLDQVITGIDKIASGLENAAKKAIKLGKAVATEVLGAGTWADELITTAEAYGISTDELQRMQKTADIIDTSVDDIMKAKQKLGKSSDALSELFGIKTDGRSIDDVFWETGAAIMAMGDAFQQEEAAQKVFGKSWRDLVPLFDAGREEYERVNSTWKTVSDDQLKSLQELDDNYQTLKNDLETLKMEALSQLAEPMAKLVDSLNQLISSEEGQQAISDVIGALKDAFTWIVDNKDGVVVAIGAIATALAGLKISEGVLTVVKTLDGLKGLLGLGGGGSAASSATGATGATGGGLGAMLKTGLSNLSKVAPYVAPFLLAIDGIVQDQQLIASMTAKGEQSMSDYSTKAAMYSGQDMFGIWDMLTRYTTINGTPEDKAKMQDFAQHFFSWWNDEITDAGLDELAGQMSDEDFFNFKDALEKVLTGEALYSTEDQQAFVDAMNKAIAAAEELMTPVNVPANVVAPDDAAAQLAAQIGTVTVPVTAVFSGLFGSLKIPGFANGIQSVPYDGMLARLHKGERVVPAREVQSRSYNSNLYVESMYMNNGTDAEGLAAAMAAAQRRTSAGFGS